jgi:hypothetical protein
MDPLPPNLSLPHPNTTLWNPNNDNAPAHIIHGSHVTYSEHLSNPAADGSPRTSGRAKIASMASNSACRVPFRNSFVRFDPVAMTSPSLTTTQPTGTSHLFKAPVALTSAARMKRSSSASNARLAVAAIDVPKGCEKLREIFS